MTGNFSDVIAVHNSGHSLNPLPLTYLNDQTLDLYLDGSGCEHPGRASAVSSCSVFLVINVF